MKRLLIAFFALALGFPAQAQDKLVVSIWGGSWRDLVAETVAKKFTQETGVPVDFITGGTIDRLNKAKTLADPAARSKLYEEMQVIEHDEAPDMKIAHSIVYEVMRKGVTGYKQSPLGGHKFNGVDVQ